MKAHEKWLRQQAPETTNAEIIAAEEEMSEKTWRAALEFVLSKKQAPDSVGILVKFIEQELQEWDPTEQRLKKVNGWKGGILGMVLQRKALSFQHQPNPIFFLEEI